MSTLTDSRDEVSENNLIKIRRAIISVSDKSNLNELATALHQAGVEIYSTGGTRKFLEDAGLEVRDVSAYTGFPEMMDGRVKTLHPKIFAGILSRRDNPNDENSMNEHEILPFDLVVVNLYPFESTIAKSDVTISDAVEQIDIGGPSLVRAAAKNHRFVSIVTGPEQYSKVIAQINEKGGTDFSLRQELMAEAFCHTANYDRAISKYFSAHYLSQNSGSDTDTSPGLPRDIQLQFSQQDELRYGENHHQRAAVYRNEQSESPVSLLNAKQLNGKQLSYNNLLDLDSALAIVVDQSQPACSVIKHNNPCGAAAANELTIVVERAFAGDPVSAFGSVVAMNREMDSSTAEWMADGELFVEAIVAPGFSPEALEILTTRPKWKKNVRLMEIGDLSNYKAETQYRQIAGGMLVQDADSLPVDTSQWKIASDAKPSESDLEELAFGWAMVKTVKSNAITLSKDCALIGVGAGQMSRVDSVNISIEKAGERSQGSFLASDAFFPFPDSIELAAKAGVRAIIQPGGSVNDDKVIAACNQHGIILVLTGVRHFKH